MIAAENNKLEFAKLLVEANASLVMVDEVLLLTNPHDSMIFTLAWRFSSFSGLRSRFFIN